MADQRTRTDPHVGRVVDGRFRLDRLLGQGGMGKVYAGVQISVERQVAIKLLRQDLSGLETLERRFYREAKTLAQLRHPNIVGMVDFGRDEELDVLYFAMEYIDGRSLAELLKRGRLPLALALGVTRQLCSGLSEAHAAGIVHRDLKPDNVMISLTAEGKLTARLLDFGIALPTGDETRFTSTGAVVGTPHYMAPEQAQDRPVDARSDLYALGVMLFEMLTGQLPFVADTPMAVLLKSVTQPPPRVEELLGRDDVPPPSVLVLLYEMLAKDPAQRPAGAAELGAALDGVLHSAALGSVEFGSLNELSDAVIEHGSEEFVVAETAAHDSVGPHTPAPTRNTNPEDIARAGTSQPASAVVQQIGASTAGPGESVPSGTSGPTAPAPPKSPSGGMRSWVIVAIVAGIVGALFLTIVVVVFTVGRRSVSDVATRAEPEVTPVVARSDRRAPGVDRPDGATRGGDTVAGPVGAQTVKSRPTAAEPTVEPKRRTEPMPEIREANEPTPEPKRSAAKAAERPEPVRREVAPPTDDAVLRTKVLAQGGWCPAGEDCNFAPTARSVACNGESNCSHSCEGAPGCTQICNQEADCEFDCPKGDCTQNCDGQTDCQLSCAGGGCVQFCHDQSDCRVSCAGGGCDQRAFGPEARIRRRD